MTQVKICGIKDLHDALAAAAYGADALGFHVGLVGARSPLTAEAAAGIIRELPATVSAAVVTSIVEPKELVELARVTGASILQLYGDMAPSHIIELKKALPQVQLWKVVGVGGENAIGEAKGYESTVDGIVLDSRSASGQKGGTGETHDWTLSRRIVESISLIPVILAGGLNPENIAKALETVRPYAVDVNSGVSDPDGSKDLQKVKHFVEIAKNISP